HTSELQSLTNLVCRLLLGKKTCARSEEHTSELQSLTNLVSRLLLEKKNRPSASGCSLRGEQAGPPGPTARSRWRSPAAHSSGPPSLFFNDTATTEIYALSLHDALPIYRGFRQQTSMCCLPITRVFL